MTGLFVLIFAAGASYVFTWVARRHALSRQIVDIPNERSSHNSVTARGGGVAIVGTSLLLILVLVLLIDLHRHIATAILVGGSIVAVLGYLDDRVDVPARWRLAVHVLAALVLIHMLGADFITSLATQTPIPEWLGYAIATACVVWIVNLYNFMDGIDGLAGIETLTVCFGGSVLFSMLRPADEMWLFPAVVGASTLGFLIWNFPKARIFMGDAGSTYLGYVMATFCAQSAQDGMQGLCAWVILLGVFFADATVTLVRRVQRRQLVYVAHRSHGYQYASRLHGSHAVVSSTIGAINLFWLLPIALVVATSTLDWRVGLVLAYTPLIFLAIRYKAGAAELQEI